MSETTPTENSESPLGWRLAFIVAALGVLAFGLSLLNDFVYDDHYYVKGNVWLRSWENLWPLLSDPETKSHGDPHSKPFWRPLRNVHYLVEYTLVGQRPMLYHLSNLLWHAAAILGLFGALRRVGFSPFVTFTAAAFFAAHPAQTEAVAWIKERDGVMGGAFLFWALYFALGRSWWSAAGATCLYACALLSKENYVIYGPLVLIALVGARRIGGREVCTRRDAIVVGLAAVVGFAFLAARHAILGGSTPADEPMGGYQGTTMLMLGRVFLEYARVIVAPWMQTVNYDWISSAALPAIVGHALMWGWLLSAVALIRRAPGYAFGVLWFFAAMLPYLHVLPMLMWLAVRFLYIPIVGIGVIVGWGLEKVLAGRRLGYRDLPAEWTVAVLLALAMTFGSAMQTLHWRNDLTLWTREYEMFPEQPRVAVSYAENLVRFRYYEDALAVLSAYPYGRHPQFDPLAVRARIDALQMTGEEELALEQARSALRQFPQDPRLLLRSGYLEAYFGDIDRSVESWKLLLKLEPHRTEDLRRLIDNLRDQGESEKAARLEGLR